MWVPRSSLSVWIGLPLFFHRVWICWSAKSDDLFSLSTIQSYRTFVPPRFIPLSFQQHYYFSVFCPELIIVHFDTPVARVRN